MAAGNISDSCVTAAGGEGSEENSPKEGRVYFNVFFFFNSPGSSRVTDLQRDFCVCHCLEETHFNPLPAQCLLSLCPH